MKIEDISSRSKKGTYASLAPSMESAEKIINAANALGITPLVRKNSLHVTVIYSRVYCPNMNNEHVGLPIYATASGFDLFTNSDGSKCLVLLLDSKELSALHSRLMSKFNATYDYPTYSPHITLSYNYTKDLPPVTELYKFPKIEFSSFTVEDLDIE